MLAVLIGVFGGLLMPLQTSVNSRLKLSVGSPLLASLISFSVGTLALIAATVVLHGPGVPDFTLVSAQPWWLWLGGVYGVVVLTGNILMMPRLGAVQTVVLPITGQVLMGLVIDHFGLFESQVVPLTATRLLGGVLVLAGVLGAVGLVTAWRHRDSIATGSAGGVDAWAWRGFGILCGMLSASQSATNGQLGEVLGSAVKATTVSFAVGALTLLVLVAVTRTPLRFRVPATETRNPWWMWIGGLLGATLVFINAFLVPVIGTGLTVLATLLGMMAGSLLIDHFGLLSSRRNPVTPSQLGGLLVMLAGVVLIRLV